MLSDTLENGLRKYQIGEKLRQLRLRKKMGLVELGRHTGLSPAMLSKIERGRLYPTLPTLMRITLAFGVGLDSFFAPRSRHTVSVVRAGERMKFDETLQGAEAAFTFECLDFKAEGRKLNAYYAEFPATPPAEERAHRHEGAELIFVLSGRLGVTILEEETVLDKGDAIYFESAVDHSYRAAASPCAAIVVTVP